MAVSDTKHLPRSSAPRMWFVAALFSAACGAAGLLYVAAALHGPAPKGIPSEVSRMARLFRLTHFSLPKSFPNGRDGLPARTLEEEYAFWFLQAYRYPKGAWNHPSDEIVRGAAVVAAERYRDVHPNDVDSMMSGYGYRRIDVLGIWSRDTEMSVFIPNGQPNEFWWLEGFQEYDPSNLAGQRTSQGKVDVHIIGYLSPADTFGHMGAWNREVFVTSVTYGMP